MHSGRQGQPLPGADVERSSAQPGTFMMLCRRSVNHANVSWAHAQLLCSAAQPLSRPFRRTRKNRQNSLVEQRTATFGSC